MPELPEVETIRQVLAQHLGGRRILAVAVRKTKLLRGQSCQHFKTALLRQRIKQVARRAKYLLIRLEQQTLLLHLGMTGQVLILPQNPRALDRGKNLRDGFCYGREPRTKVRGDPPLAKPRSQCATSRHLPDKHTHLILTMTGGLSLYFRDPRQFGRFQVLDRAEEEQVFAHFGPEPLTAQFTPKKFYQRLRRSRASLKALLLNQKVIAGLGNIYADEALFRARLSPERTGKRMDKAAAKKLRDQIRRVLRQAIKFRGTSISNYCDPERQAGGFQQKLRVYARAGKPCVICGQLIRKAVIAQRGTHWCPNCQSK